LAFLLLEEVLEIVRIQVLFHLQIQLPHWIKEKLLRLHHQSRLQ
jgi:hypothetical protein